MVCHSRKDQLSVGAALRGRPACFGFSPTQGGHIGPPLQVRLAVKDH
jgi:hypothetical protein